MLRAVGPPDPEPDLTPAEIALTRVRLTVFTALELGASRQDVEREVAEAARIRDRRRT